MKTKFIILTLAWMLAVVSISSAQATNDVLPDEETIRALEKLPMATRNDTALAKLTVTTRKNVSVHLSAFKRGRRLVNANGFGGAELIEIKKVIDFSVSEKKVLDWIEAMRQKAIFLYNVRFDDAGSPLQNRIAYSWGSKEYAVRANPPGVGDNCTYKIYGLDCSGFIYQLLKLNGIMIPKDLAYADQERKPDFLKKHLKSFFGTVPFDVVDKKKLEFKDMHSGDIIYFKNSQGIATHIAIVFVNDDGTKSLYQSLGSPNRSMTDMGFCNSNLNKQHGVIASTLNSSIQSRNYGCVRVVSL